MFNKIKECLYDAEIAFKKIEADKPLTNEDEIVFSYFELNLADAIMNEWADADLIAKLILDENKRKEIRKKFKLGILSPCYDYEIDCPHRNSSGSCNVVACEYR